MDGGAPRHLAATGVELGHHALHRGVVRGRAGGQAPLAVVAPGAGAPLPLARGGAWSGCGPPVPASSGDAAGHRFGRGDEEAAMTGLTLLSAITDS
jgi:hypothetical protein